MVCFGRLPDPKSRTSLKKRRYNDATQNHPDREPLHEEFLPSFTRRCYKVFLLDRARGSMDYSLARKAGSWNTVVFVFVFVFVSGEIGFAWEGLLEARLADAFLADDLADDWLIQSSTSGETMFLPSYSSVSCSLTKS